jgi:hypothetical protein
MTSKFRLILYLLLGVTIGVIIAPFLPWPQSIWALPYTLLGFGMGYAFRASKE